MTRALAQLELDRSSLLAKLEREGFGLESVPNPIVHHRVLTPGNIEPAAADRSRRRQQRQAERDRGRPVIRRELTASQRADMIEMRRTMTVKAIAELTGSSERTVYRVVAT